MARGPVQMSDVYRYPRYYEIAFSFRDIEQEVDLMEELISRYSLIPVASVLEIACGNSPHMPELLSRGYHYTGIDISPEMLAYSREKAGELQDRANFLQADLSSFTLPQPVDFAYVLLGSLYVKNNQELLSHFRALERSLRSGGLYLLDWCVSFSPFEEGKKSWKASGEGISVEAQYEARVMNKVEQTILETITISAHDGGKTVTLASSAPRRLIYPQEFLFFLSTLGSFEFLGWWNNWNLEAPLAGTEPHVSRPIVAIRKK